MDCADKRDNILTDSRGRRVTRAVHSAVGRLMAAFFCRIEESVRAQADTTTDCSRIDSLIFICIDDRDAIAFGLYFRVPFLTECSKQATMSKALFLDDIVRHGTTSPKP